MNNIINLLILDSVFLALLTIGAISLVFTILTAIADHLTRTEVNDND